MTPFYPIKAEIRYLRAAEGGRNVGVTNGSRGRFYCGGDGQPWDGCQQFPDLADETSAPLGKRVRAIVQLTRQSGDGTHARRVSEGMPFEIREGTKVVGYGIITKVLAPPSRRSAQLEGSAE